MTGIHPDTRIMACCTGRSSKLCGYYMMKHGIRDIGRGLELKENQMAYLIAAYEIESTFGSFTWTELRDSMIYAPTYLMPFKRFAIKRGYIAANTSKGHQGGNHLSPAGIELVERFWESYEDYERYYRELSEVQFADYLILIRAGNKEAVKELRLFHKRNDRNKRFGLAKFAAKSTGAVKEQYDIVNKVDELTFE